MEGTVTWAGLVVAVAEALARRPGPAEGVPPGPSLLAAVTGAEPLRSHSRRAGVPVQAGDTDIGPVVAQNELPVRLLASGLLAKAAQAVAGQPGRVRGAGRAGNEPEHAAVTGIVAVAALSTVRLDQAGEAAALAHVRKRAAQFDAPNWAQALDALAERTAELSRLLAQAAGVRHQSWPGVAADDRYLAEAVAAAVVGGAASPSGEPPQTWLFPFHIFCHLGVSAALASARTIERWLGIEFLPLPGTPDRLASLAVLVAAEASSLSRGCGCKVEASSGEVAYAPRGPCRQDDHDLAGWRPGQPKPGSQRGARYAATLWGWQRRWLGGANAAATADSPERPRLRPNDVASSVLVRRWLSTDRGYGGPALLYDRILPEFCLSCGRKVELSSRPDPEGRHVVQRLGCCADQRLAYRSEFTWRAGRRLIKPKLGLVVAWPGQEGGTAGYVSTAPLGPLWLCRRSGRYSLSARDCPAPDCRPDPAGEHEPVQHGWVLLPRADAWAGLMATGRSSGDETAGLAAGAAVREEDLRFLARICSQLPSGNQCRFQTPGEVWALAKGWSKAEMYSFTELAGTRGLELLLSCKENPAGPARTADAGPQGLNSGSAAGQYSHGRAPGSECSDRGD